MFPSIFRLTLARFHDSATILPVTKPTVDIYPYLFKSESSIATGMSSILVKSFSTLGASTASIRAVADIPFATLP